MSNFTQAEVDQLVKGGNGVARKTWLATWTPEDCMIPEAGDEKKIKAFIRQCFVRGQWSESKLPTTEPLENLVGKDAVQSLRIGTKAEPTYMGKAAHLAVQTKPQTFPDDPFEVESTQSEWDPFNDGNTTVSPPVTTPAHTPEPAKPTPANPFSSFKTVPPQQPIPEQPTNTKPPSNPLPPQKPVDVHSLFVSTPVATQPPAPVTVIQPSFVPVTFPFMVNPNPHGVPQTFIPAYGWPQPPVITVPSQPPAVQTGPDAFSGLLAGFGSKPTAPW